MSQENFNTLYSNLQIIYNCKNDIHNALVNKNQNMTNVDFSNYSNIVTNLKGKVATLTPNLPSGTEVNLKNTLSTSQNVIVTDINGNFNKYAFYNNTNNSIITKSAPYNTSPQQVFEGTFIGSNAVSVKEGKLGMPYVVIEEVPNNELNIRLNALWDLSDINFYINSNQYVDISNAFRDRQDLKVMPWISYSQDIDNAAFAFYNSSIESFPAIHALYVEFANYASMFENCRYLTFVSSFTVVCSNDYSTIDLNRTFANCVNLRYINSYMDNLLWKALCFKHVTNISSMFERCNNLSDDSINSIVNDIILHTDDIPSEHRNLNVNNIYSPFYLTNITSDRYSNYLTNLAEKGWLY